jgi:two-component system response regulator AtoC
MDQDIELLSTQKDRIISQSLKEIHENPSLSEGISKTDGVLQPFISDFLSQLIEVIQTEEIKAIPKESIEPILKLWHTLIQDQIQKGLTAKETALMIYAIKTSISKFEEISINIILNQILDMLGILSFELYATEQELMISRQQAYIQDLQTLQLKSEESLVSNSDAMKRVYQAIQLILEKDVSVLLEGESGTGKDVIARLIHQNSDRRNRPFVAINCGAIPKELIESELFGHEIGSFTGAERSKVGKFEIADGGTLFLDEIGELSLDLQVKLLRALQNKEIERVGGNTVIKVNLRIISATNQSLKQLVHQKKFRLDLFYRLNVYPILIPSLRERQADIVPLASIFIQKYSEKFGIISPPLTVDAERFLENHAWEGNIRELENCIQRALILSKGKPINSLILGQNLGGQEISSLLSLPVAASPKKNMLILPLEEVEKTAIVDAINLKKGNLFQVAKALKISRTTLYNKIEKYRIKIDKELNI